jgi:hypothetical protein
VLLALPKPALVKRCRDMGARAMSLWDLLTAFCFVAPIAGANSAARAAGLNSHGHFLATLLGVVVGIGCAGGMRAVGELVIARLEPRPDDVKENGLRVLYFAAIVWSFCGLFIGGWATRLAMPILR